MSPHNHGPDPTIMIDPPVHPVPQLQGPFEESMLESTYDDLDTDAYTDPVVRRNILLEAPTYQRVVAGRWKQKSGEKYHPLWKLISQISFGVHLLAEGIAKSEEEVMQILQAHVDEVDGFLERTTEDFDLAQEDIQERLRCLKLPLSHPATFEKMLEDRNFRLSIVEGNEKIEHIVDRTAQAMKDSLKDVLKGFDSSSCLESYLMGLAQTWQRQSVEHEAVYIAMLGNVEGWCKAFMALHLQGNKLGASLKKLIDIVSEMQARAGEVSRRLVHQAQAHPTTSRSLAHTTGRVALTSKFAPADKTLTSQPSAANIYSAPSMSSLRSGISNKVPSIVSHRYGTNQAKALTPPNTLPSPQEVAKPMVPCIVEIESKSQGRVQSVVPLLVSPNSPQPAESLESDTDEICERYFPPVELPAFVPPETMRSVPMSNQNRMSSGLGLRHAGKTGRKRSIPASRATLADLLRLRTAPKKLVDKPEMITGPSISAQTLANGDDAADLAVDSAVVAQPAQLSVKNLSVIDQSSPSFPAKNNVWRPRKGIQHWFEAVDDESDTVSDLDEPPSVHMAVQRSVVTYLKPSSEHGSLPGTPAWAKTQFGQYEVNREHLKKGVSGSHPPDRPLGSPPVGSDTTSTEHNASRVQEDMAYALSATLGEPGPEISTIHADSTWSPHQAEASRASHKRDSRMAPEVLLVERVRRPPATTKVFIVEVEDSFPILTRTPELGSGAMSPPVIPELDASRSPSITSPGLQQGAESPPDAGQTQKVKHEELLRRNIERSVHPSSITVGRTDSPLSPIREDDVLHTEPSADLPVTRISRKPLPLRYSMASDAPGPVASLREQTVDCVLPTFAQAEVATPQVPLPPSPSVDGTSVTSQEGEQEAAELREEQLFLLPATTYQAPISPQLPPDPVVGQPTVSVIPATARSSAALPSKDAEVAIASGKSIQRERRPINLQHTRTDSTGSHNGWKAFFQGQPSPVGSTLSIRSIKATPSSERGSSLDQRSPVMLTPRSAERRFPGSNSASESPVTISSVKDTVWFAKSEKPSEVRVLSVRTEREKPVLAGLGIASDSSATVASVHKDVVTA